MENASKALIIAGAILISILIISFGVIILGQGGDVIQNANMNETEMAAFNGKFTAYEGKKVSGSNVRQLIRTANQSNANNESHEVRVGAKIGSTTYCFAGTAKEGETQGNVSQISTSDTYSVSCSYENGWVKTITIGK